MEGTFSRQSGNGRSRNGGRCQKPSGINEIKTELDAVKVKIDRINNGFTDGSIDIREFKELKNPLVTQKVELEQKIATFRQGSASWLEPMKNWIFQANQPEKWVLDNNWGEMKTFLKRVGSNRLLQAQTLTVTFKKPWNYLAETNIAVRSTAEISDQNLKWWGIHGKIRTHFKGNTIR